MIRIPFRLRELLIRVWSARGGGFYGLGYVFAFVYFELTMLAEDFADAGSAGDFAFEQLIESLLRLTWLSFINVFQALLWPALVAGWWNGGGLLLLAGSYALFEYLLKPRIDAEFPELIEQREIKQQRKVEKAQNKAKRRRWFSRRSGS